MRVTINKSSVEESKTVLSQYLKTDGIGTYWYEIHSDEMDATMSEAVLVLLGTRLFALSLRGSKYILYYYNGVDAVNFTRKISKNTHKFAEGIWNEYFCDGERFYYTYSLDRYFYEEKVSDVLDVILKESYKLNNNTILVLTMIYPQNLTLVELDLK